MVQLKNIFIRLFDFIIYGNVLIAICAAMSTLSTAFILNNLINKNDLKLALFVGAATFFLYNLHKPITYFLRKQFIDNQRFRKTKTFQTPLSILTVLAGIYCFYFFFKLALNAQILLIGMAFLSLGYVLPILGNGRRLRDLAYLKIFLIAIVWAAITVVFPLLDLNIPMRNTFVSQLFIERACFIFALCIPFDIRDMDWDIKTNVKTIPLSIGVKNAKIMGISALIIAILMVLFLKSKAIYSEIICIKSIIIYLISILILIKTNKTYNDYFFYGLVDGMILIQSLIINKLFA